MNYIGSKKKLLDFVARSINQHWSESPGVFCDAFAGTGVVSERFKKDGWSVQSSDIQRYSTVRLGHILLNNSEPQFAALLKAEPKIKLLSGQTPGQAVLAYLNTLPGKKGFIYQNYCLGGTKGGEYERQYFSDENGMLCDAIRAKIALWQKKELLSEGEADYLLASLLEAIDARANTASVYGAFLKHLKKSAQTRIELKPLPLTPSKRKHAVYQTSADELVKEISGDVLYLDPPYNQRQYAANYHLLETIALADKPKIKGKTGLRDWSEQKSPWCSRATVLDNFEALLDNADYAVIALSYNDEGLMDFQEIEDLMSARGKYKLHQTRYNRFRADKAEARNHKRDYVTEHLHILEKDR